MLLRRVLRSRRLSRFHPVLRSTRGHGPQRLLGHGVNLWPKCVISSRVVTTRGVSQPDFAWTACRLGSPHLDICRWRKSAIPDRLPSHIRETRRDDHQAENSCGLRACLQPMRWLPTARCSCRSEEHGDRLQAKRAGLARPRITANCSIECTSYCPPARICLGGRGRSAPVAPPKYERGPTESLDSPPAGRGVRGLVTELLNCSEPACTAFRPVGPTSTEDDTFGPVRNDSRQGRGVMASYPTRVSWIDREEVE